jgi:hypothetical protein
MLGSESDSPKIITLSLVVLQGCNVERKELKYISNPYLPAKLIGLAGNSGEAKSPITRDQAACVTTGLTWPDRKPNPVGPRSVLMLNGEDDLSDTILTGLDAMGADDTKFYYIKATKVQNKKDVYERQFAFDTDMQALRATIVEILDLGMIFVDPVQNYLGEKDMNTDAEMRSILTPLAGLADELGICVETVHHFNSREKGTPLQRIMGAKALSAVARCIYLVGPDTDEDGVLKYAHTLVQGRGVTGSVPSMKYHTALDVKEVNGKSLKAIKIVWDGQSDATAEDAVNFTSHGEKTKIAEYATTIGAFLSLGRQPASACCDALKKVGWGGNDVTSTSAIKKKAKARSITVEINGAKVAMWELIPTVIVGDHTDAGTGGNHVN